MLRFALLCLWCKSTNGCVGASIVMSCCADLSSPLVSDECVLCCVDPFCATPPTTPSEVLAQLLTWAIPALASATEAAQVKVGGFSAICHILSTLICY